MDAVVIAGAGFALNVLLVVWALAWNARGIKSHVDTTTATNNAAMVQMMNEHQMSDNREFSSLRHEFGEISLALREKISETELWNRDNFVRRETFNAVTESWHNEVRTRLNRIDERLNAQNQKPDSAN